MLDKILISQCFLGDKVRYNGQEKRLDHSLISLWQSENRLVGICPEVRGGLSVPREPAEQNQISHNVITRSGLDVTEQFNKGAQLSLDLCKKHHIRFAILKESSPSCGSNLIYDGSFSNKKIPGQGVTSKLLIQSGIKVFSEHNLEDLVKLLDK